MEVEKDGLTVKEEFGYQRTGTRTPHRESQELGGSYDNQYPYAKPIATGVVVGVGVIATLQVLKYTIAILGAPETGGASLLLLATP